MLINYYPLQSMSMAKGRYVVGRTTATFIFQEKEMKRFFFETRKCIFDLHMFQETSFPCAFSRYILETFPSAFLRCIFDLYTFQETLFPSPFLPLHFRGTFLRRHGVRFSFQFCLSPMSKVGSRKRK